MKHVAVFGSGGMLGRAVEEELQLRGHNVFAYSHNLIDIGDPRLTQGWPSPVTFDAMINCAGVRPGGDPVEMAIANTVGPHVLAARAAAFGIHLVHVSTDCVFSGLAPEPYKLSAPADAESLYGRTKAAGEPYGEHVTVVRTSFIGPDHGVLGWLLTQEKAGAHGIEGWRRAQWTGSTVWAVARYLVDIALRPVRPGPIVHLATAEPITKYEVLRMIKEAMGLNIGILPVDRPEVNRALVPSMVLRPIEHELAEIVRRCKES